MIDWNLAWTVIISGLVIVFLVLYLLILMVQVMGKIFGKNAKKPSAPSQAITAPLPAPIPAPAPSASLQTQTVAVIAAAVNSYMQAEAPGVPYAVTSIAPRASARPKDLRPVWGFAGMRQNTEPF